MTTVTLTAWEVAPGVLVVSVGRNTAVRLCLEIYADAELISGLDLIVQCWTLDEIDRPSLTGLIRAVSAGTAFAGWHGGIADSFRNSTHYLQMVGGQFVAHGPQGGNHAAGSSDCAGDLDQFAEL
ncbi:type 1 glutamine amidotransferase [Nakamurella sp. UYEF19]